MAVVETGLAAVETGTFDEPAQPVPAQPVPAPAVPSHIARVLLSRLPDADAATQRQLYRLVEDLSPSAAAVLSGVCNAADQPPDLLESMMAGLAEQGEVRTAVALGTLLLTPLTVSPAGGPAWVPDGVARWLIVAHQRLDQQGLAEAVQRHQLLVELLAQRLGLDHQATHQAQFSVNRLRSLAARHRWMTGP